MYKIIIPYLAKASQGQELRYAIEGWRRHFKEDHEIIIVGESCNVFFIEGNVSFVHSPRVGAKPGSYRQHLDYVSCFTKVYEEKCQGDDGFIFVADDCYAVNDFTIEDVKSLKMLEPTYNFSHDSPNMWRRDKAKTKDKLLEGGYPTINFTTHLPQWFEWDKLIALWKKYDMYNTSYVFEDMYYNIYNKDDKPIQLDRANDKIKLGIYNKDVSEEEINNAFKNKIWINNSPAGWSKYLDKKLKEHYGLE